MRSSLLAQATMRASVRDAGVQGAPRSTSGLSALSSNAAGGTASVDASDQGLEAAQASAGNHAYLT